MHKKLNVLSIAIFFIFLSACQSISRRPDSLQDFPSENPLQKHYLLGLENQILKSRRGILIGKTGFDSTTELLAKIEKNQRSLNQSAESLPQASAQLGSPKTLDLSSLQWRSHEDKLEIRNLDHWRIDHPTNLRTYSMDFHETTDYRLTLSQRYLSQYLNINSSDEQKQNLAMNFQVSCSENFVVHHGALKNSVAKNKSFAFKMYDAEFQNDSYSLSFSNPQVKCRVQFSHPYENKFNYEALLIPRPSWPEPYQSTLRSAEVCAVPLAEKLSGFEKHELNSKFGSMTCPQDVDSIQTLEEPAQGLTTKVESLLGQPLPKDFMQNANPYAALDFSKAPKLDVILISYLVFRADFGGTVISRLLQHHARQGTQVVIYVSDVISLQKDKLLYEKMMAASPNIKVIRYRYDTDAGDGSAFSTLHRTNHIKVFLTASNDNPDYNRVIIGGRNIHDGFIMKKPLNPTAYPEVVNYQAKDEFWAHWRDFEILIKGRAFTLQTFRHLANAIFHDESSLVTRNPSLVFADPAAQAVKTAKPRVRHYISNPIKDDPNLFEFYKDMIDSAQKRILISSPYFRPEKVISDALDRALKRGVQITVVTRLDLEGDTADFILSAVNKDGVNAYLKRIHIFEYTEPATILHSKLFLIDGESSFISSVNLNKRSFYHDTENGVLVNDRAFTKKMEAIYADYLTKSRRIEEKQKIQWWMRIIINTFDREF